MAEMNRWDGSIGEPGSTWSYKSVGMSTEGQGDVRLEGLHPDHWLQSRNPER